MTKPIIQFNLEMSQTLWAMADKNTLTRKLVDELVEQGADINYTHPDNYNNSVFMGVVLSKDTDIMLDFLERGVDVNFQNTSGYTVAHWVCSRGTPKQIEILAKYETKWKIKNQFKDDPVSEALTLYRLDNALTILNHTPRDYFNLNDLKTYQKILLMDKEYAQSFIDTPDYKMILDNIEARHTKIILDTALQSNLNPTSTMGLNKAFKI